MPKLVDLVPEACGAEGFEGYHEVGGDDEAYSCVLASDPISFCLVDGDIISPSMKSGRYTFAPVRSAYAYYTSDLQPMDQFTLMAYISKYLIIGQRNPECIRDNNNNSLRWLSTRRIGNISLQSMDGLETAFGLAAVEGATRAALSETCHVVDGFSLRC